ncbi:MAG: 50S ribosomal protein L22 [Methanomicrobiales archaeon]|nr:50S ribosomal protein L22 [Methanomicrobiales archaeon]
MARINYSNDLKGAQFARGIMSEAPISPKHAIEIARFIKGMNLIDAEQYLNNVVALKKPIPFKRFNRNVAHKRGLDKWDAGRYPEKAARVYLKLLNSIKKNAEYDGLDTDELIIVHTSANRGMRRRGFMPRAMGRATAKDRESVNIEIIVEESEE